MSKREMRRRVEPLVISPPEKNVEDVNVELDHFKVSLHSDVFTNNRILDNTASMFTVPLHEPLIFPSDEKWEVALLEIFFPTSIKNVEEDLCEIEYRKEIQITGQPPHIFSQTFRIPAAAYTPLRLVRTIQNKLSREKIVVPQETISNKPSNAANARIFRLQSTFRFNLDTNKVVFKKAPKESFYFNLRLLELLGLDRTKTPLLAFQHINRTQTEKIVFHFPPRLDKDLQMMFVYTDIVRYSQMANSPAPIIRMLHLGDVLKSLNRSDGSFIGSYAKEFLHAQYHPIQGNEIKEINVQLRNSRGELINFHGGITVLNLRFVRRK